MQLKQREVIFLKTYVKAVLYTYPLLKTVGRDYEEHIRNKALLSYDSSICAEKLVEYIAEEILCKEKLEWLKELVESVLSRLSDEEKALMEIRYFGRPKKIRSFARIKAEDTTRNKKTWSERMYFRRQNRLYEKVAAMLKAAGLTEECYKKEFSEMDLFKKVDRFIQDGKDKQRSGREKRWLAKNA